MYERKQQEHIQRVREELQHKDLQSSIEENLRRGQEDAKVTIGRASELFDIKQSKLRELDILLNPVRSKNISTGQRQYSLVELKKLAIIAPLLKSGWSIDDIPFNIDEIWQEVSSSQQQTSSTKENREMLSIDKRVESASKQEFWRYFASQALRLSLSLISEDIPNTTVGIILPLNKKSPVNTTLSPEEVPQLGECFIGWLSQNHTFRIFYDPAPFFEYPSDYRIHNLQAQGEQEPKDSTRIVSERRISELSLPVSLVETIRRLLVPLYEDVNVWKPYFDKGMRDNIYPAPLFSNTTPSDSILTTFANMIVRLGGKTEDGKQQWRFCCILLPNSSLLPLQLRSLVVRAQSEDGPHVVNQTFVSPETSIIGLSQRAFQSGRIIYRPYVSIEDSTIDRGELEMPIRSAIAVPIEGEGESLIGVLYVVSAKSEAFAVEDQSVLRIVGRMIGEQLSTVSVQQKSVKKLRDVVMRPGVVDKTLEDFASENDFIRDVESLLRTIQEGHEELTGRVVSFISIDINNQSSLANMYGDQMSRNLSRVLGERIRDQVRVLFDRLTDCRIYHSYADRFYLLMDGASLKDARENAERLKRALQGTYHVSATQVSIDQPRSRVQLKDITVRLGVSSYEYKKLYEVLLRYPSETTIADTRAGILHFLDVALNTGKEAGGNVIISWYPPEPPKYERGRFALWPSKIEDRPNESSV